MATDAQPGPRPLEDFRDYLRFLARLQLGPMNQRVRSKLEASDIVQDVMLKAHAARDQLKAADDGATAAWLRRILANTLIDAVRQLNTGARNVAVERSLEAQLEQSSVRLESLLAASDPSVGERELGQLRLLRLAKALEELPADQRQAVELMHLHGCPVVDIAEKMGKTPAAVGGLLRRGMKALRETLTPNG